MRINCIKVQNFSNKLSPKYSSQISFGQKVINPLDRMSKSTQEQLYNLLVSENLKEIKMTFSEGVKILEGVGCRVTRKTGSHATAHKDGCSKPFTLPDPHEESGSNIPTVYLLKLKKFLTETVKTIG